MMAALVRKFNHGQICFHPEDHITKEQQDLCTLGNQLMSSVDPHTKLLHRVLQGLASTRGQEYPPGTDVTIPKRKENLQKMPLFWGSAVPTYDQDNAPEELNWKQWMVGKVSGLIFETLRLNWLMPLTDMVFEWDSEESATKILQNAVSLDLAPLKMVDWTEMKSEFAIERWCFSGIAAHATKKLNAIYIDPMTHKHILYQNDWSWMVVLETRDGFERYGATAYFNEQRKLVQILYANGGVEPPIGRNITIDMDEDWKHAKWVFKCSAISGVTLRDHLVGLHFMASNFLAMAEAEYLGGKHPVRRLLRPFTYGTVSINLGAIATLAVENGKRAFLFFLALHVAKKIKLYVDLVMFTTDHTYISWFLSCFYSLLFFFCSPFFFSLLLLLLLLHLLLLLYLLPLLYLLLLLPTCFAYSLRVLARTGLLHRASAFTWESLQEGFLVSFDQNRFQGTVDQFLQEKNMLKEATSENASMLVRKSKKIDLLFSCIITF